MRNLVDNFAAQCDFKYRLVPYRNFVHTDMFCIRDKDPVRSSYLVLSRLFIIENIFISPLTYLLDCVCLGKAIRSLRVTAFADGKTHRILLFPSGLCHDMLLNAMLCYARKDEL